MNMPREYNKAMIEAVYRKYTAEFSELCAGATDAEMMEVSMTVDYDIMSRQHMILATGIIAGIPKSRVTIHERWPVDWWQAFRERWLPAWWLRRHPVKYREINVDQAIYGPVCPHTKLFDTRTKHLQWMAIDPPSARNSTHQPPT